jgi:hypothetical protein
MKTACTKCGKPLPKSSGGNGGARQYCGGCAEANAKESRRRYDQKRRKEPPRSPWEGGMTWREVAKRLGITEAAAQNEERRALRKLREKPELLKVWGQYQQEGQPDGTPSASAEDLLDWQFSMGEMYELAERLKQAGCEEEAWSVLKEVEAFQRRIGQAIGRPDKEKENL